MGNKNSFESRRNIARNKKAASNHPQTEEDHETASSQQLDQSKLSALAEAWDRNRVAKTSNPVVETSKQVPNKNAGTATGIDGAASSSVRGRTDTSSENRLNPFLLPPNLASWDAFSTACKHASENSEPGKSNRSSASPSSVKRSDTSSSGAQTAPGHGPSRFARSQPISDYQSGDKKLANQLATNLSLTGPTAGRSSTGNTAAAPKLLPDDQKAFSKTPISTSKMNKRAGAGDFEGANGSSEERAFERVGSGGADGFTMSSLKDANSLFEEFIGEREKMQRTYQLAPVCL